MSDEANAYYEDIIDQMTVGLTWVQATFGVAPSIGWHVDPFGHQAAQAYLFSKMGFNAWFFARIDYQDKQQRLVGRRMETVWRPNNTDQEIFSHVQYHHYSAPPGFNFDIKFNDEPVMDNPQLEGYNLDERAKTLVEYFQGQALHYRTSNLIHTFGEDFTYIAAGPWYKNIDRLMKRINSDPSLATTLVYSTPGKYTQAIFKENQTYPLKQDDFFPYADVEHGYWAGYYVSRTALKGMVRDYGRWLQSARSFAALAAIRSNAYWTANSAAILATLQATEEALGVLQHHDAVSGTAKQAVTNDYYMIGCRGKAALEAHYFSLQRAEAAAEIKESPEFFSCPWNASKGCDLQALLAGGKEVLVQVYNPGHARSLPLKMGVPNARLLVADQKGQSLSGDIICNEGEGCLLLVVASLPEQANSYFKVKQDPSGGAQVVPRQSFGLTQYEKTWELGDGRRVSLEKKTLLFNFTWAAGTSSSFLLSHKYYESYQGEGQKSGAYIFRPSNRTYYGPLEYSTPSGVYFFEGQHALAVLLSAEKVSTTLWFYKGVSLGAVDLTTEVGAIPLNGQGKEVVMSVLANEVANGDVFFTDSSGLHMQRRVLNVMPQYNLTVHEPLAGNYYPVTSLLTIVDKQNPARRASLLTDRSQGGLSPKSGVLELMVQRRTTMDDSRGVGEPLDEKQGNGEGLTQRLRHTLIFDGRERAYQKSQDQWPLLSFAQTSGMAFAANSTHAALLPVPPTVKLYLRPLGAGSYLVRLHNTAFEDSVALDFNWPGSTVVEMTLAANQRRDAWEAARLRFRTDTSEEERFVRERRLGEGQVSLKKGDILTFKVSP